MGAQLRHVHLVSARTGDEIADRCERRFRSERVALCATCPMESALTRQFLETLPPVFWARQPRYGRVGHPRTASCCTTHSEL